MCEFAVCQTVSGVTVVGVAGQRPTVAPSAATARPLRPPRPGRRGEAARDALEQVGRIDAVVVGKGDEVGLEMRERRVPRAREPARGAQRAAPRATACAASSGPTRSSAFWSTTTTRKARCVCAASESRSAARSSVRSTVATTRSSPSGSAAATGAGYPHPRRGLRPLVSVVLAARDAEATIDEAVRERARPDLADLELARRRRRLASTGRRELLERSATRGSTSCATTSRSASPARSTSGSRRRAARTSRAWTQTTSRSRLARAAGRAPIRERAAVAIVGTGMIDLHERGRLGSVHRMPSGARAVRWAALFSSPFFHPTVLLDRASSSATASATTPRSARARTSTCGRGCSSTPTETTCARRSSSTASIRRRRRRGAPSSSAPASGRSRCGRSPRSSRRSTSDRPSSPGAPGRDCRSSRTRRPRQRRALARARDGLRAAARWPRGAPRSGVVACTGAWRGDARRTALRAALELDPALALRGRREARPQASGASGARDAPPGGSRARARPDLSG